MWIISFYVFPPVAGWRVERAHLPERGGERGDVLRANQRQAAAHGFIPRVHGEAEHAPVYRHKAVGAQVGGGLGGFFGVHVVVAPAGVVLPVFNEGEVYFGEALPDLAVVAAVAAVARKIDGVLRGLDNVACPQGFVEVAPAAAAVVPCGHGVDFQAADGGVLPPIQLDDARGRDAPFLQQRAQIERHDKLGIAVDVVPHGELVQVVVVVVAV